MKPHIQPYHDRSTRQVLKKLDAKSSRQVVCKHESPSVGTGVFAEREATGAIADYMASGGRE